MEKGGPSLWSLIVVGTNAEELANGRVSEGTGGKQNGQLLNRGGRSTGCGPVTVRAAFHATSVGLALSISS